MRALKKIKFTFPFPDWPIERQLPKKSMVLGDYKFYINDLNCTRPDYWIIFDGIPNQEEAYCAKENIIFFTAEPPTFKRYNHDFLQQFGHVITCQKDIKHPNVHFHHQGHPWFVGKSYDELVSLTQVPKSKAISIVTSNKQITDGHKKRLEFCQLLKAKYENEIDLFGRGIREFDDKWEVLAPYRYSIAIENEYLDDWFTEKLYDCFLAYTVPLYYGCPNLEKYFNLNAILKIDIENVDATIDQIDKILETEGYDTYFPHLKKARSKYLNQLNIFYLIISILKTLTQKKATTKITLQPEMHWVKPKKTLIHKLKSIHGQIFK